MILEVKKNSIIVMSENGDFEELPMPSKKPRVGKYIDINASSNKQKSFIQKWMVAACVFLFFITASLVVPFIFDKPAAVVALDINPSVEFHLNEQGIVKKSVALNSDGQEILNMIDIKGLPLEKSLDIFLNQCIFEKILSSEKDNLIFLSLIKIDDNAELPVTSDIEESISTVLQKASLEGDIVLENACTKDWREAQRNNISVNKLKVIKQLPLSAQKDTREKANLLSIKTILTKNNLELKTITSNIKRITNNNNKMNGNFDKEDQVRKVENKNNQIKKGNGNNKLKENKLNSSTNKKRNDERGELKKEEKNVVSNDNINDNSHSAPSEKNLLIVDYTHRVIY